MQVFRCHFPEVKHLRVTAVNTHHDCSSVMTSDICALHSDCYWLSAVRECRANELLASAVKRVKCSGNAWAKFSRFLCSSYHFSYVLTEMGMHVFISFPIESDFQPMQIMQCLWNFRGSRFTRTTTSGSLHRFLQWQMEFFCEGQQYHH